MLSFTLTNHFAQGIPFFRKLHQKYHFSFFPFMGRRISGPAFATYARAVASRIHNPRKNPPSKPKPVIAFPFQHDERVRERRMERPDASEERVPLSVAVSDCVKRWFNETLKLASAGDTSAQILVAQMYRSGYGVAKNKKEAKIWIKEASEYRSSAMKDFDKRPGYNGSDSNSDEVEESGKQYNKNNNKNNNNNNNNKAFSPKQVGQQ